MYGMQTSMYTWPRPNRRFLVYTRHVVFAARFIARATTRRFGVFPFHRSSQHPANYPLQNPVPWGGAAIDGIEMVMARGKCVMIVLGGSRSCSVGSRCGVARHRSWLEVGWDLGYREEKRTLIWERWDPGPGSTCVCVVVYPERYLGWVCVCVFVCLSSRSEILLDGSAEIQEFDSMRLSLEPARW